MTDLSAEALLARRALAEKATPGPWVQNIPEEDDFDNDCSFISTPDRNAESVIEIAKLEYTDTYSDEPTDFVHEQRANAAYIAAFDPTTVMAYIDEILRLRAEVERQDKEADWLATRLANALIDPALVDDLQALSRGMHPPTPEMLREAARKAEEKRHE